MTSLKQLSKTLSQLIYEFNAKAGDMRCKKLDRLLEKEYVSLENIKERLKQKRNEMSKFGVWATPARVNTLSKDSLMTLALDFEKAFNELLEETEK